MTLIRPDLTARMELGMEQSMELTLEQRILGELGDIKESQMFMRVTLLGGTYRDIPHQGKLPLLEAMIELQAKHIELCEKRVVHLEEDKIGRDSALTTTRWMCGILATVGATAATLVVNLLSRH